jgi:hypothetical protein
MNIFGQKGQVFPANVMEALHGRKNNSQSLNLLKPSGNFTYDQV